MAVLASLLALAALTQAPEMDMWELARENADVLRYSTLFTARQVPRYLGTDEGIEQAVRWCKDHGVTHVYLESFRDSFVPPQDVLAHARDRFRQEGFLVSGCITPAGYGRRSNGWAAFSCYTAEETRLELRRMSEYAAGLFDEVMIDDFLASDRTCAECREAKGERSWAEYRSPMMVELSRTHILEPARAANPDVEFIIKFPQWYERFQDRGYVVDRQSEMFDGTWVGTEVRGTRERGFSEPPYMACWLMRWLIEVGGEKCGGGWHDTIRTGPTVYLEQDRQTILGGAREVFLFNFGALQPRSRPGRRRYGAQDAEALRGQMPLHFELARLIRGKAPRGLLGWKPPNSDPGPDTKLHPWLGMVGLPQRPAASFDADAPGFIFGRHVLHDPGWLEALTAALETDRPVVATPAFLRGVAEAGGAAPSEGELKERLIVLPEPAEGGWSGLREVPQEQLDALRDAACRALGARFHAPADVALYLFEDDLAVVESFRDEPARCTLALDGWAGYQPALALPGGAAVELSGQSEARLAMPPRSLVVLRRK